MSETPVPKTKKSALALVAMALFMLGCATTLCWIVVVDALREGGASLGTAAAVALLPLLFAAALAFIAARLVRSGAWRPRALVFMFSTTVAVLSLSYLTSVAADTTGSRIARTVHETMSSTTGDLPLVSGVLDKIASEGGAPPRRRAGDGTDAGQPDGGAHDAGVIDAGPTGADAGTPVRMTTSEADAGSRAHPVLPKIVDAGVPLRPDAGTVATRPFARPIAYAAVSVVLDTGASAVARLTLHDDDTAQVSVISLAALAARGPLTRAAADEQGDIVIVVGKERVARVPMVGELDVIRELARGTRLADGAVVDSVQDALPLLDDTIVAVVDAGAPLVTRLVLVARGDAPRVLHEVKKSERTLLLKAASGDTFVVEDRPLKADPNAPAQLLLGHASGSGALQTRARGQDPIAPLSKAMGAFGSVMIRRDAALVVDVAFADVASEGWPVLLKDGAAALAWLGDRYPDRAPFAVRTERLAAPVVEPSGGFLATTGGALVTGDLFAPESLRRTRDPVVDTPAGLVVLSRIQPLALSPNRRVALIIADAGATAVRGVYVVDMDQGTSRVVFAEGSEPSPGIRVRTLGLAPAASAP